MADETPVSQIVADSTFAGYLTPSDIAGDMEDAALRRFWQRVVVNVTGLPGTLVRPRWQPEPPNQPAIETNWAALGAVSKTADTYAFEGRTSDDAANYVLRHQVVELLVSFYGPAADALAEQFSVGLQLAQNRIVLKQNGWGLIEVREAITVPALLHERWLYGVEVRVRVRRAQKYTYRVLEVLSTDVVIYIDDPVTSYTVTVPGGN